jgi:hypothetical protein
MECDRSSVLRIHQMDPARQYCRLAFGMVHDEQMASEFRLSREYRMAPVPYGRISDYVYCDIYVYFSDRKNG